MILYLVGALIIDTNWHAGPQRRTIRPEIITNERLPIQIPNEEAQLSLTGDHISQTCHDTLF